jgi:predicted ArsR family transcriptional regulator
MKPTMRLRILDHIRRYQTTSVLELSRVLGVTGANIRHHLAILESNELIEIVDHRKEGRGRPLNVYGLSRKMLGDGLDELASGLLEAWLIGGDDRTQQACLRSVAERIAGKKNQDEERSVQRRITQTIIRLNELHYQARWEASAAGPRLIMGHCPYSAIIINHPELCQMDAYLLETQINLMVDQTEKLQLGAKGLPFCAFLVKGKY